MGGVAPFHGPQHGHRVEDPSRVVGRDTGAPADVRPCRDDYAVWLGARVPDGHLVSKAGEVVGGGQAGWPRTYHQHPLARRRRVDGGSIGEHSIGEHSIGEHRPAATDRLVTEETLDRLPILIMALSAWTMWVCGVIG